jgi:uncharacterized repeat protein (TIGR01451 family)
MHLPNNWLEMFRSLLRCRSGARFFRIVFLAGYLSMQAFAIAVQSPGGEQTSLVITFTVPANSGADLLFFRDKITTLFGSPVVTARLFNGNTLLGTSTQNGPVGAGAEGSIVMAFKSLTSPYTLALGSPLVQPTPVDFTSIDNGTIVGVLVITVTSANAGDRAVVDFKAGACSQNAICGDLSVINGKSVDPTSEVEIGTVHITSLGYGAPTLTKVFAGRLLRSFYFPGELTTLTFTLTNTLAIPLTGVGFTDSLPGGFTLAGPLPISPCGGVLTSSSTAIFSLSGAALAASGIAGDTCVISVQVVAPPPPPVGLVRNAALPFSDYGIGVEGIADARVYVPVLTRYASNLGIGDSVINLTNAGTLTDPTGLPITGNLCANIYTFDASEELISCCSCLVTPNGLNSLSARNDLISNTLTPGVPTSIVIKLVGTTPLGLSPTGTGGTCNPSSPIVSPAGPGLGGTLVPGLLAWGTTLHSLPTTPVTYSVTETEFEYASVSDAELTKLTTFCGFIQSNGSGFGICKSCRTGGLGTGSK